MRFFLFLLLTFPLSLCAQKFPVLKETLQNGSVSGINDYIFNNKEVNAHDYAENNMYWRLYREVMPGYYEGTLQIYYSEPYINERKRTYSIRIHVLVKDSTIFHYTMKMMDETGRYNKQEDSSISMEMHAEFLKQFRQLYGTPLNAKYLFIDSINYGNRCRVDGDETAEYKKMKEYVSSQNQKALGEWLRCGNTELQLFAVKGFMSLEQRTVTIAKEHKALMSIVLTKKGNVNLCRDGVERRIQMRELIADFKTD